MLPGQVNALSSGTEKISVNLICFKTILPRQENALSSGTEKVSINLICSKTILPGQENALSSGTERADFVKRVQQPWHLRILSNVYIHSTVTQRFPTGNKIAGEKRGRKREEEGCEPM